ncbi:amidase [Paenibacillus rhizosphaerae]|uniref:Amidase n=1 Tax=Paenibacillus rhizosphaerae TaxID=297318 RepID=A0A839TMZ5_9BACL|nr:amidase [Paenibacillus rhizosphaerae]MBB3127981.1 amidase [Paenibacillus rhizosphaerae]
MQPVCTPWIREGTMAEHAKAGPLQGLTFAVKDVFAVADHTNTAGNPDWLRTHLPAVKHAAAVERLLGSGAKLRGMTHTDELMFSLNGENVHYGTPPNPNAPGHIPGGSSSGSASAVASGEVDVALGTDTAGSVRIPSSFCGICGFRPTHGGVSMDGVIPLAPAFDTVGWMARRASTLLQAGRVLLEEPLDAGGGFTRMLLPAEAWAAAEPSCAESLRGVLEAAGPLGGLEPIRLTEGGLAEWAGIFRTVQGYEIWSAHGEWIMEHQPRFGPGIAERFAWTATVAEGAFWAASQRQQAIAAQLASLLGSEGVLVIPTAPCGAPKIGLPGEEIEMTRTRIMQLSCIAGLGGLPQVTLPLAKAGGLPVGLSLIAGRGQDLKLLRWAADIEASMQPAAAAMINPIQ